MKLGIYIVKGGGKNWQRKGYSQSLSKLGIRAIECTWRRGKNPRYYKKGFLGVLKRSGGQTEIC